MSRAAKYGNIQPEQFEEMDWEWASEIARRVTLMHEEETKMWIEVHTELTKAIVKASGASIF